MEGINTTLDLNGNGGGGGGAAAQLAVSITYAALKALRDGGKLVPGTWYRITDYITEFSNSNAEVRSAGHQFDIIVLALDASHLAEDAYAAHHDGDTYFVNSKLEAWRLKYRLSVEVDKMGMLRAHNSAIIEIDNEGEYVPESAWNIATYEELMDWYETTDYTDWDYKNEYDAKFANYMPQSFTKGIIYYMKDEFGNKAPYDFKNLQFKRYSSVSKRTMLIAHNSAITDIDGQGKYVPDSALEVTTYGELMEWYETTDYTEWSEKSTYDAKMLQYATPAYLSSTNTNDFYYHVNSEDFIWAYTFSSNVAGGEQSDMSLSYVPNNVIGEGESLIENINVVFYGRAISNNNIGSLSASCTFVSPFVCNDVDSNCMNVHAGSMAFSRIGKNTRNCVIVGDYLGEDESPIMMNCQVLAGISDMEIHFDMEKDYVQCAGLDSNGDLKIWNPADLVSQS